MPFKKPAARVAMVLSSLTLVVGLTACAPGPGAGSDQDRDYLYSSLEHYLGSADGYYLDEHLSDQLPNHVFSVEGRASRPLSSEVVVGRITKVKPGRAFTAGESDATSTQIPFTSSAALWRSLELTIQVDESWPTLSDKTIRVGLSIDGTNDPDKMMKGLRGMPDVIVALSRKGFYRYDPALYNIARSGALFGEVATDGTIELPLMDDEEGGPTDYLAGTKTIDQLRSQARGKPVQVKVRNGQRE